MKGGRQGAEEEDSKVVQTEVERDGEPRPCDKRVARLISYIHHTCEYRQYCYVGSTAQQCRLGLFQDSDFAGDLEDSKS